MVAGPTPLSSIELLSQCRPLPRAQHQSVLARLPTWQDVLTVTDTAELLTEETLRETEEDILTCSVLSAGQDPFPGSSEPSAELASYSPGKLLLGSSRLYTSSQQPARQTGCIMAVKGAKALEVWARRVTDGYPNVRVRDMSRSWKDGLAFCAILHKFRPDLLDFDSLDQTQIER